MRLRHGAKGVPNTDGRKVHLRHLSCAEGAAVKPCCSKPHISCAEATGVTDTGK